MLFCSCLDDLVCDNTQQEKHTKTRTKTFNIPNPSCLSPIGPQLSPERMRLAEVQASNLTYSPSQQLQWRGIVTRKLARRPAPSPTLPVKLSNEYNSYFKISRIKLEKSCRGGSIFILMNNYNQIKLWKIYRELHWTRAGCYRMLWYWSKFEDHLSTSRVSERNSDGQYR